MAGDRKFCLTAIGYSLAKQIVPISKAARAGQASDKRIITMIADRAMGTP
jgi:hypothetical protein